MVGQDYIYCSHCERAINTDEERSFNTPKGISCQECYKNLHFNCGKCFNTKSIEDMGLQRISDKTGYCKSCVAEALKTCKHCGEEFNILNERYDSIRENYYHRKCFELYFWCDECGNWELRENSYHSEDTGRMYCDECWDNGCDEEYLRNENEFECNHVNLNKNTFKHLRDKRCFGIEIEVDDRELPYYKVRTETHFGSKHDGSLECGSEFYSPILQGDIGYNQVKKVCDILKNSHIGRSTGLHLHLDMRNETWETARKIWALYTVFEGVLLSILPKSRQWNDYARRSVLDMDNKYFRNLRDSDNFMDYWYEEHDNEDDTCDHYNSTRYSGCNLHSLFYQSTIEIRYHSGTTDFEKIMNWVKINQAIFRYAKSHSLDEIRSLRKFGNCKTNYGIIRRLFKEVVGSDTLWRYYKIRFNKFSSHERDYGFYMKQPIVTEEKKIVEGQIDEVSVHNTDAWRVYSQSV